MTGPSHPSYGEQPGYTPAHGTPQQPRGQSAPPTSDFSTQADYRVQPTYATPAGAVAAGTPGSVGRIASNWRFGILGTAIAVIGAIAAAAGLTSLKWISESSGGVTVSVTFTDLHNVVRHGGEQVPTLTKFYFGWLAWALVGVLVVVALLANSAFGRSLRLVGLLIGLASAAATFFSLKFGGATYADLFKHAAIGFWLTIAGFVVAGVGATIGPRRVAP
jgi:hypothetical protein